MHSVPFSNEIIKKTYLDSWNSTRIFQDKLWPEFKKNCLGIFCFSEYSKSNVLKYNTDLNVNSVYHPTEFVDTLFNINEFNKNKELVLIGHWLRNFQEIYDLKTSLNKVILKCGGYNYDNLKFFKTNNSVSLKDRMSNENYDKLLSRSIVFLPLFDSSANNSVLECIVRNTPFLIPKLPAVIEYVGEKYPFYYSSLEEAEFKLNSNELIFETSNYLNKINKERFNFSYFVESITNSSIIRNYKICQTML